MCENISQGCWLNFLPNVISSCFILAPASLLLFECCFFSFLSSLLTISFLRPIHSLLPAAHLWRWAYILDINIQIRYKHYCHFFNTIWWSICRMKFYNYPYVFHSVFCWLQLHVRLVLLFCHYHLFMPPITNLHLLVVPIRLWTFLVGFMYFF